MIVIIITDCLTRAWGTYKVRGLPMRAFHHVHTDTDTHTHTHTHTHT